MADNQSQHTSVAPGDSVSSGGRKTKPGKQERAARRSAVGSQPGNTASAAKAFTFASTNNVPKPSPGKFPVVFQTGAGEPSRDQLFGIDNYTLCKTLGSFPERFVFNAKYAEFTSHAGIDDATFYKDVGVASLLRLSQQVVHAHVNMGLPQGDFSPVASTEVKVPGSIAAYLAQYGEFSVPALGTRFLFADYENEVRSLIWAADQTRLHGAQAALERLWLPVRQGDGHTKAIIASRLSTLVEPLGLIVTPERLEEAIFSGSVPDVWETVKQVLGETDEKRDRFDFVFRSYANASQFVTAFTTSANAETLVELGLRWRNPSASHVDWNFNPKEMFTRLSDGWARKSATYALFFELSSSQSNRHAALGSQSQMAEVTSHDGVTILKTHLALSAPEFSLAACFPASCYFFGVLPRRVVVTTPLSVVQRGTEFVQLDWR